MASVNTRILPSISSKVSAVENPGKPHCASLQKPVAKDFHLRAMAIILWKHKVFWGQESLKVFPHLLLHTGKKKYLSWFWEKIIIYTKNLMMFIRLWAFPRLIAGRYVPIFIALVLVMFQTVKLSICVLVSYYVWISGIFRWMNKDIQICTKPLHFLLLNSYKKHVRDD